MKFAPWYIRSCFVFTLLESVPRLLSAGQSLLQGRGLMWAIVYLILYGMMLVLALRMFLRHHVQSAQALITLRIGLCISLVVHYGMTRPLPPVGILMARELLPLFQLFLAYKAKGAILSLAKQT